MAIKNPLRLDPSRTTILRKQFMGDMVGRFQKLGREITSLIVDEDVFGLKDTSHDPFDLTVRNQTANASYCSTQVNLDNAVVHWGVRTIQQSLRPDDVIKLEDEPHVTVRYGLHNYQDMAERVQEIAEGTGPIFLALGKLSLFSSVKQDVLKLAVDSPDLHRLNDKLAELQHTEKWAEYRPHMTIAYLQPGTGKRYLKLANPLRGMEVTVDEIVFSNKERVHEDISLNTRYKFLSMSDKVEAFRHWLAQRVKTHILLTDASTAQNVWWEKYIYDSYQKGVRRGTTQVSKRSLPIGGPPDTVSVERVKVLAGRVFTDLKGITDAMSQQITRELVDGFIQGKTPEEIAKAISKKVKTIGIDRARTLARTEIVRAQAEAQLDTMEKLGITHVNVDVEWQIADEAACPLCKALDGIVLTIQEARGMIPRHANCRCSFKPVLASTVLPGQIRSKRDIQRAIDKSVRREIPKKSKRSLKQQKKLSTWKGAGKTIKNRPRNRKTKNDYGLREILGNQLNVEMWQAVDAWETLNGGKGSGNFGHKGRPGLVGGSGEGGSSTPSAMEVAGANLVVKDMVDIWKYHGDVEVIDGIGRKFEQGGVQWEEGGNCQLESGKVKIFVRSLGGGVEATRRIMAHEMMHGTFEKVILKYQEEQAHLTSKEIRANGRLKPEFATKFPTYNSLWEVWERPGMQQFAEDDGITDYSKAYWKDFQSKKVSYHIAVHETLAEIAAIHELTGVIHGSKLYRDLYKSVRKEYRILGGHERRKRPTANRNSKWVSHVMYLDSHFVPTSVDKAVYISEWFSNGQHRYGIRSTTGEWSSDGIIPL